MQALITREPKEQSDPPKRPAKPPPRPPLVWAPVRSFAWG
jgi:hypothetical protein